MSKNPLPQFVRTVQKHPYEPTPYRVLERLGKSGLIGKNDVVPDYGCGKGRVGFFLSYLAKAKTIGIEYDARIYQGVLENQKNSKTRNWFSNSGSFYFVNS